MREVTLQPEEESMNVIWSVRYAALFQLCVVDAIKRRFPPEEPPPRPGDGKVIVAYHYQRGAHPSLLP